MKVWRWSIGCPQVEGEQRPGWHGPHVREKAVFRAIGGKAAKKAVPASPFDLRSPGERLRKRARVRREQHAAAVGFIEQWLNAQPVATGHEPALEEIDDDNRPHPAQPFEASIAPRLVRREDGFGVVPRGKHRPARLEVTTHFGVVVELAVVADPQSAVPSGEWLGSLRPQIAHRQAPKGGAHA